MTTVVIVKRGKFAFQRECDRDQIRDAMLDLKKLHPSAFRDTEGLSAEFVSLDENQQIVGKPESIPVDEFVKS